MPIPAWSLEEAPRLDGRRAIVTGSTGGIGYETALGLARQGAITIIASRDPAKGIKAADRIERQVRNAAVRFETLDLASLASIKAFAAAQRSSIDILVNNAGVMGYPTRQTTSDGFERQIGVNYLGHFVLTALLKDQLAGGRVVSVASLAHRRASLGLDDFLSTRSYSPMQVYARSKLAMLVFALELQRRAVLNGWNIRSIAAHPGWARTDIIGNGIGAGGAGLKAWLIDRAFSLVAQSAASGALPSLYAATAIKAQGGAYYGPTGPGETRGPPGIARIFPRAADIKAGKDLWALSEQLTGIRFI